MQDHEYYMSIAMAQAKKAFKKNEVPIGAIIVKNNKIISKAFNKTEKTNNGINHAEVLAIERATKKLKNWRLIDCTLYVTLQPCLMCTGAIIESRIKKVIYAAESNYLTEEEKQFIQNEFKKNEIIIHNGIQKDESATLLNQFFKKRRKSKNHLK